MLSDVAKSEHDAKVTKQDDVFREYTANVAHMSNWVYYAFNRDTLYRYIGLCTINYINVYGVQSWQVECSQC